MQSKTLLSIVFTLLLTPLFSQTHWESLIVENNDWLYLVPTTAPSSNWTSIYFDDRNWSSGTGGFGYADNDDKTLVPIGTTSIYLRKTINFPAETTVENLVLDIDYDDAFVAYLNGTEIARSTNLVDTEPGIAPNVSADHEAVLYNNGTPERYGVDASLIVTGYNVLAVQIINISNESSDLSGRVFLSGELSGLTTLFNDVPSWFTEYTGAAQFTTTELPIIFINTLGETIVDDPKITAQMTVADNPNKVNYFNPILNDSLTYDGFIGVEIRGNTAQMYPKKSYTVETRNEDGSNNNVSLFGMPKENDWVLHGPYSDKSMMRNVLAYEIGNSMGRWSPRTQFVELVINDEYRGVYVFEEKIKIDKNRVDIANLKPTDIEGDEVTGGYIVSIDRVQDSSWNSPYIGSTGTYEVTFSNVDPKPDELTVEQKTYIKNYITSFEDALHGDDFMDPILGYRNFIDINSFIDFFFITEISRDIDGYRVSVYFHKDKDSKGGKLNMSPLWDFNLCFGNANFYQGGNTVGWAAEGIGSGDGGNEIPFWWDRFKEDPYWQTTLKYRWEKLRKTIISDNTINHIIDSCYADLKVPATRNFETWNILNQFVWPNVFPRGTYDEHVNFLRNWVIDRMSWMDSQIELIVPTFPENIAPVVDAGANFSIYENALGTITTTATDENNDPLTFRWKIPDGVQVDYPDSANISFLAPSVDADTDLDFKLTVSDGQETVIKTVTVTILNRTNIDDSQINNTVKVYPNPFSEKFSVQLHLQKSQNVSIEVRNLTGQLVAKQAKDCLRGTQNFVFTKNEIASTESFFIYRIFIDNEPFHVGKLIVK